jgi:hypothetical protein
MREVIGVALFLVAVGLSVACLMQIITAPAVGRKWSLVWTAILALAWAAWYVAVR